MWVHLSNCLMSCVVKLLLRLIGRISPNATIVLGAPQRSSITYACLQKLTRLYLVPYLLGHFVMFYSTGPVFWNLFDISFKRNMKNRREETSKVH